MQGSASSAVPARLETKPPAPLPLPLPFLGVRPGSRGGRGVRRQWTGPQVGLLRTLWNLEPASYHQDGPLEGLWGQGALTTMFNIIEMLCFVCLSPSLCLSHCLFLCICLSLSLALFLCLLSLALSVTITSWPTASAAPAGGAGAPGPPASPVAWSGCAS